MSFDHRNAIARPLIDRPREVRVIRALCPQESLNQSTQSPNLKAVAAAPTISPTYQNTGIQTLPPANGSVFKLIHGREPSHYDYAQSMGSAGMGRFINDTRKNPFALLFGSAYIAPTAVRKGKCTDSGFQTASHDTRIKALARAKVKASMMANKYRNDAFKAGYIIGAESHDEMIVHSEQIPSTVQLDTEGNLLEGNVKSRSLPNIYGALVHDESSQALNPRQKSTRHLEHLGKKPMYVVHGVQTPQAPCSSPTKPFRMSPQQSTAEPQEVPTSIPALEPASVGQSIGAFSVVNDEYGSWGPVTDEFVVFDAGAEHNAVVDTHDSRKMSRGKRKAGMSNTDNQPSKKHKSSAQVSSCTSPVSLMPRPVISSYYIDQDCSDLPLTPDTDVKPSPALSNASTIQLEDFAQGRVISLIEAGTPSPTISENDQSPPTDISRQLESEDRRETLQGQSDHHRGIPTRVGARKPTKAGDDSHTSQAIKKSESARLTGDTLEPIVSLAVAGTGGEELGARVHRASRRSNHPFEKTDSRSIHGEQVKKLARQIVGKHDRREGSFGHKIGPMNERHSSADRSVAEETSSRKTPPIDAIGTDITMSGRRRRTSGPHISQKIRQAMAPYVPPAKRLRDLNKLPTGR